MEDKPTESQTPPKPVKLKKKFHWGKKHTLAAIVGGFLALILVFVGVTALSLLNLRAKASAVAASAAKVQTSIKAQDLVTAKQDLTVLEAKLTETYNAFKKLSFWRLTPLAPYYQDGERAFSAGYAGVSAAAKAVSAVEPYADILGLKGEGSFTGGTAEDRIVKIIETAGLVAPVMDQVSTDLTAMETEIDTINPARYPFTVNNQKASDLIAKAQTQVSQAKEMVSTIKPALEALPEIAGLNSQKKYLVIFQNDGELRPTGGFMTAYSVMNINKGKITPEKSDDIYDLDNKFDQTVTPPDILKKYLLTLKWNLRDMNTSPDFKVAMDQFLPYYQSLPGESKVDGVIAIDTQLLSDLVSVLGAIDVPGYGRFSSEIDPKCNCPQIIYALEDISTKPTPYFRSDRKAILGPMMGTILQKAYSSENSSLPQLVQTVWRNLTEKHILLYFPDSKTQAAAENLKLAGRVDPPPETVSDYFLVVDANLGGAKSNMFVRSEVEQDIKLTNGQVSKKVVLTYKNPQKGSNCNLEAGQLCLNGKMPSWVRVYVPKGSVLNSSSGFEPGSEKTYEDLGYTVFEGVYKLDPESIAKISLDYSIPYTPQKDYLLSVQKQAGLKAPRYLIKFNGSQQEFDLVKDQKVVFPL